MILATILFAIAAYVAWKRRRWLEKKARVFEKHMGTLEKASR